jgi:DNA mismatch repair ATPase MutS
MITKIYEILNQKNSLIEDNNDTYLFKIPINYIEEKYHIEQNIKSDLELLPTTSNDSLYNYLLNPSSEYAKKIIPMWSTYYTNNKEFLLDSQNLIKKFKPVEQPSIDDINNVQLILDELSNETGFYEKYKYMDVKLLEPLNNNSTFLQILTLYNLTSPILSLLIPIIMLILPFFILKLNKISISLLTYIRTLMDVFKNHVVGRALTGFSEVGWDKKILMIMSIIFYFINIYQNIITCRTFYKNIYKIRKYLITINSFLKYSINSIDNFNLYCKSSYNKFVTKNKEIKLILLEFSNEISLINLEKISIKQIGKIGNILKSFYNLFKNQIYKKSIIYSLYLFGYIENITHIQKTISQKVINYCKFTTKESKFKDAYFAALINNKPIKNTYGLNKNILITGPNAAGKTTLLKTTLFNVILSQQIGIGFYKKANINPYRYIHSYINIPDTSDRDSLFQAEARRCKEILDTISNDKSLSLERHFCIFDEIYSGTNPTEAIASAYSFLKYISKNNNIDYILTTHYITLCKMMHDNNNISNQQMEIKNSINTYKLVNGISNIKGGIKVLQELGYNQEIIDLAKDVVNSINI